MALDRDALLAWLREQAKRNNVLVHSVYQGLVTRIEDGQFDEKDRTNEQG